MLITFSTVEAVTYKYQQELLICGLLSAVIFSCSLFVFVLTDRDWRPGLKWSFLWTSIFVLASVYAVREETIGSFIEARIETGTVSLNFASSDSPVILTRDQLLDITVHYGAKSKNRCNLIVIPKEGWHYESVMIDNFHSECEKYRDQAIATLHLQNKISAP